MISEATSTPAPRWRWARAEYAEAARRRHLPRSPYPAALTGALLALLVLTVSSSPQRAPRALPAAPAATLSRLPLPAQSLVSSTLGRDQASYGIHRTGNGLAAQNATQGLSARFNTEGVQVHSRSGTLSLRLRAAGYGSALQPVPAAVPRAHANRVLYRRGSLSEWYANGPLGLEQGFTLKTPPAGHRTGPLALALSLSGGLRPALDAGGRSLTFAGANLRYTGLSAFDARGQRLPARLELRGQRLLIRVNDEGARYPLTIDPFVQQAKLTSSAGAINDHLGNFVAISGDTIVAGAPDADIGANGGQGAAYVFVRPAGGWANETEVAKLTASDGQWGDNLGNSVAISGDTIVAGALWAHNSANNIGAAYVFVRPAGGWKNGTETAKLIGPEGTLFAQSVAIEGDTIVADGGGAVHVFVKPAGGWTNRPQTAELNGSDSTYLVRVAIAGDTIVAGDYTATVSGHAYQGAVYVFVEPAGGWTSEAETAKLTASNGQYQDYLGVTVAVAGDTIVAGASGADISGHADQGAAYVFVEPAGGWATGTETAELTASDGQPGDRLGNSVAISGDTIVAGAQSAKVSGNVSQGAAYVFVKPAGGWANGTETAKLTASDGAPYDWLGRWVTIEGGTIVAGAPGADISGHPDQGAAYVYWNAPTAITVTKQLLPASDPGRFDLKVAGTVVKAGAGNGGSGVLGLVPGTYRVGESAAAGTTLSDYSSSIACTVNGAPGPFANGTAQVEVTVAAGDQAVCTITNRRKATISLAKHLVPSADPGRFDLKVGGTVVKAAAGDGDSGSTMVAAGTYTLSEVAAPGTTLPYYAGSIACTLNGKSGPSGVGTSLKVTVNGGDVLACTVTNQPGATFTLTKHLVPSSDPGRFDLRVGQLVVKGGAGDGGSGSVGVVAGTYRVTESGAAGTVLPNYATSIACTFNGNPGPSADGTTQLDVTVAVGDRVACTLTNRRKATITVIKHLVPSSDPGRFDLKVGGAVVKAGAGDGGSGARQLGAGTYAISEAGSAGTSLADYTSSIACTRNGGSGPSGNGTSLNVTAAWGDVLVCTIANQRT